jgi:16S rRNA (adenine1518-N6/adenine1519-N6)-dimethyltransferase
MTSDARRPRARKRFGQHFLEAAWADKLVTAIDPRPDDRFLEIGPGPGALTLRLAPRVQSIVAIEIDRNMAAALESQAPGNVRIIRQDFLGTDITPLPSGAPLRVAGNLPYNVSSPILFKLLDLQRSARVFSDATLMLQREVADRIEAVPGTGDYGVLAVLIQLRAEVQRLLTLPPGAFRPPPKVHSAAIRLRFRDEPAIQLVDEAVFTGMIRSVFTQRRKTLNNALRPFAESRGTDVRDVLRLAPIDPMRRPETLTLQEFGHLANLLAADPAAQPRPPASS